MDPFPFFLTCQYQTNALALYTDRMSELVCGGGDARENEEDRDRCILMGKTHIATFRVQAISFRSELVLEDYVTKV